jgi:hypothetical protein
MSSSLVSLLATVGLLFIIAVAGRIGFAYGYEVGACSATCKEATAGLGVYRYYGGACHCTLNSVEVVFP